MITLNQQTSDQDLNLIAADWTQLIAEKLNKKYSLTECSLAEISEDYIEQKGIDMLVFTSDSGNRQIQNILNATRDLRVPYLILTPEMKPQISTISDGDNILIPVTMFEEELSKAEIATSFGRFLGTHATLVKAHDYGTRAEKNIGKIRTLIEKFNLPYKTLEGNKDSYKVEMEVATQQQYATDRTRMLVISASRDYGIDDLLFGPKERHIIKKATIPVLLLNPRGDLYSLCD